MKKLLTAFMFSALLAVSACVDGGYISADAISPTLIAAPMQAGSAQYKHEVKAIITQQKHADKIEVAAAQAEAHYVPELVTGDLSAQPKTATVVKNASQSCEKIVHQAKDFWHIARPYLADTKIKALITPPPATSYAYPSGHTACSLVVAKVFAQISGKDLGATAEKIAAHRVLGGVHWQQDVDAGKQMGLMIFGALQTSGQYRNDISAASSEWVQ